VPYHFPVGFCVWEKERKRMRGGEGRILGSRVIEKGRGVAFGSVPGRGNKMREMHVCS
jgi:hypothetical protein